jgi:anaerobic selenocysteine-containing dehydrogenase
VPANTLPTAEKYVVCSSCDAGCLLKAEVRDGEVVRVKTTAVPPLRLNICIKGVYAPKNFSHPSRLLYPQRCVGQRGSGRWERVTWDEALDGIAERLQRIVARHGPEAFAVSNSPWNTNVENGACRRFMNLLGSPNWTSGVALCAGNTGAINRMVYGWFPFPDFFQTNCIVLFGHNPKKHSWTPFYNFIRGAEARGAKLIVLDPRKSESAERATLWLPLRAGTDAAMCLGWVNVIIEEGLYNREFVEKWTVGFDELKKRVAEYPLDRVAAITGVDAELIRTAARMYATSGPAVIPWTPISDQQVSSTSAIRLHCTLRALTGNLDVPGGEVFTGFLPGIRPECDLEAHDLLSDAQKAKQLGSETHPAFTYRGTAPLAAPTERVWGKKYANIVHGSYMASPPDVFRAMAHGKPYPVKAFFSLGNNTLMGFANMKLIRDALMAQDLVVVHEHQMTPTAQLADYVLPGDSWLERAHLWDGYGWIPFAQASEKAIEPPGECRGTYDFWRQLAVRMGFAEQFPWQTVEEVLDYRLEPMGKTFQQFAATTPFYMPPPEYRKYEKTGFATPSGKVELSSSILAGLGFDPLPYHREPPRPDEQFPLTLFVGVRDDEYFHSGQRHVEELRKRKPLPKMFLHETDASNLGLVAGDWAEAETRTGKMKAMVEIRADMPRGLVRVPHGWWLPETTQGSEHLSGAWQFADAQLCSDDEDLLDREQGVPHLKGFPCRVSRCEVPPAHTNAS